MTTLTKQQALKQIDELRAYVEELDKKDPVEVVGQYEGDAGFYSIDSDIDCVQMLTGRCLSNNIKHGNSFRTREQAERRLQNIKTHERLKRLAAEAWDKENVSVNFPNTKYYKWSLVVEYPENKVSIFRDYCFQRPNTVYFPTKQSAQATIDEIGEEAIKQYIEGDLPA